MAKIIDEEVEHAPIWLPPRSDWPELHKIMCICSRQLGTPSLVHTYKYYVHTMKVLRDSYRAIGRKYRIDKTTVASIYRRLDERRMPLTPVNLKKVLCCPIGPFVIDDSLSARGDLPIVNFEPWQEKFGIFVTENQ